MNEHSAAERNPTVEHAEQQALGTTTYQKAEVVHQYADSHPWVHPVLLVVAVIIILAAILYKRKVTPKGDHERSWK